jgi:hypothetical protein
MLRHGGDKWQWRTLQGMMDKPMNAKSGEGQVRRLMIKMSWKKNGGSVTDLLITLPSGS